MAEIKLSEEQARQVTEAQAAFAQLKKEEAEVIPLMESFPYEY